MTFKTLSREGIAAQGAALIAVVVLLVTVAVAPARAAGQEARAFATPEQAVSALLEAAKASDLDGLIALFGSTGGELISSSDPATARRNRDVFVVAMGEGWRLVNRAQDRQELVVGNEAWPFPVPLVKRANGWTFDATAGSEEVLLRRIGRNELAAMRLTQTYVRAQQLYARKGHDAKPAGIYARRFASAAGSQNGLYWPAKRGEPQSPLGPLVAEAAAEGRTVGDSAVPFHGYYFRVLERQGPAAPGGEKNYVADGDMSGGFALVAWPAQYDATGIMTFMVNQDGVVYEKDLGAGTATAVTAITAYNPDSTWQKSEMPDGH